MLDYFYFQVGIYLPIFRGNVLSISCKFFLRVYDSHRRKMELVPLPKFGILELMTVFDVRMYMRVVSFVCATIVLEKTPVFLIYWLVSAVLR